MTDTSTVASSEPNDSAHSAAPEQSGDAAPTTDTPGPADTANTSGSTAGTADVGETPADGNAADHATPDGLLEEDLDSLRAEIERLRRLNRQLRRRQAQENSLKPFQVELLKLQRHLEKHQRRMIVLFEGRDAAGKGGTIRRVTRYMNEKHYRVVALGKPTEEHRTQWYFQRYVEQFPHGGEMVLFDRSWYNRAMVEPVFGFCTPQEYENFLRGVVGFEKDLVRQGAVLVKLYFSVTKEEQQRRFDRRRDDPLRQWKLSEIDVQAQEHWDDFTHHKYEMLRRTHTARTPWTVIRSENKHQARLNAMRVILNAVDYEDRDLEVDFVPDREIVYSGAHEVELMEADRLRKGRFEH